MPAFRTECRIEFADTDMAGIAHFASFFRYMEAAEHAFLRARGLSVVLEWEGEKLSFPRVSASCDYQKPARFEDVLEVTVEPTRVGRRAVTYAFTFLCRGECLAKGQMTSVCCRIQGGRVESVDIPDEIRQLLTS